jgi:hypothetical protein
VVTVRALAQVPSPRPAPAPVTFDAGAVVVGGRRMSVGEPGDAMAVGRWRCGSATVALLRPATGEVFRFDGWASTAKSVDAVRVGTVSDAVGIHAVAGARPGCDDIAVGRATGPPLIVWRAP